MLRNLIANQFEGKHIIEVLAELREMGIEPNPFTFEEDTTIILEDYVDIPNSGGCSEYFKYEIEIIDYHCRWSEMVED